METNIKVEHANTLREQLREIDYADPGSMKVLYQFKLRTKHDMEDNSLHVRQEYRDDLGDWNRHAARFEKVKSLKKNVGLKARQNSVKLRL